jgi:hypothetical protein
MGKMDDEKKETWVRIKDQPDDGEEKDKKKKKEREKISPAYFYCAGYHCSLIGSEKIMP